MKLKTWAVFLLSILLMSAQLLAFNGQIKGFILGGGLGAGYLRYERHPEGLAGIALDKFSLATNFKIGYAPSNSLEIYFFNSASWFGYNYPGLENAPLAAIGVTGVGLTKYLSPKGNGFFVFVGGAWSFYSALSSDVGESYGFGLVGGIGYDLSKHWSLQGDVLFTSMESGQIRSLCVRATLNFLAF
jgi:hypothetical protein